MAISHNPVPLFPVVRRLPFKLIIKDQKMLQKCVSTPYKLTLGLLAALEITKIGILTLP